MKKEKCPYCNSRKTRKAGHDKDGLQRYYCNRCKRKFTEGKTLKRVMKKPCSNCNSFNVIGAGFLASGKQRYYCKDCNTYFSDGDRGRKLDYTCAYCNSMNIIKAGYGKNGKQRLLCKDCGKKFSIEKRELHYLEIECPKCHSHKTMKNGTRNDKPYYKCKDCGYNFIDKPKYKRVMPETKQQIKELYAAGMLKKDIAKRLGLSVNTITVYTKEVESPINIKKNKICEEILAGKSIQTLMKEYNVSRDYIQRIAYKLSYKPNLTEEQIQYIINYGKMFNISVDNIEKYINSTIVEKLRIKQLYRTELERGI